MGKNKRQKQNHTNHHDNPNRARNVVVRRQHSQQRIKPIKTKDSANSSQQSKPQALNTGPKTQQQRPVVPFTKHDQVLLVGEGDFSFASSLAFNHDVNSITATCFDTESVLVEKYPDAGRRIGKLQSNVQPQYMTEKLVMDYAGREQEMPIELAIVALAEMEWNGFSDPESDAEGTDTGDTDIYEDKPDQKKSCKVSIHYGIDATKLSSTHKKVLRPYSPFTKIVFNFPHVGGLSTDVNRQVRANQQLLVGFFNAAKPLLATPSNPVKRAQQSSDPDVYPSDYDSDEEQASDITDGQILVTIFEGEPYTLWNIRDLARHAGLKVVESFKFPWAAYPGYKHARTIGDITTGMDRSEDGKRKGAWRGEERDARCYVLALKDSDARPMNGGAKKKKKEDGDDDSD